jgi:hypothetical protein
MHAGIERVTSLAHPGPRQSGIDYDLKTPGDIAVQRPHLGNTGSDAREDSRELGL